MLEFLFRVPATLRLMPVEMSRHAQVLFKQSSCIVILIDVIATHAWSRCSTFIAMARTKTSALMQRFACAAKCLLATTLACWRKRNYIPFALSDRPTQHQRKQQMVRFIIPCQRVILSRLYVKKIQSVGKN